jgi:hypothetical protein
MAATRLSRIRDGGPEREGDRRAGESNEPVTGWRARPMTDAMQARRRARHRVVQRNEWNVVCDDSNKENAVTRGIRD